MSSKGSDDPLCPVVEKPAEIQTISTC
jgi:hypothetical protein